jgi:uncharacterized protein (TIGR03435 family)
MVGAQTYLETGQVVDQTGLKGTYDFSFKYGPKITGLIVALAGQPTPTTSLFDAMEKQLGLRLEAAKVSTPVLMVDSVNRTPSANPPEVSSIPPLPTEFEVADVKLSPPPGPTSAASGLSIRNGRVEFHNIPVLTLINLAFTPGSPDRIVMPKGLDAVRVDVIAKLPSVGGEAPPQVIDLVTLAPALKALLVDRFKMTFHTEDRQITAHKLTAAKPKMKKAADPLVRAGCKTTTGDAKAGEVPLTKLTCQNITMAEFADLLPSRSSGYVRNGVEDATGLEGRYDFSLSFSQSGLAQALASVRANANGPAQGGIGDGVPSDPAGEVSLFDAISRELGLKLETVKRTMPVTVIDHVEEKPTEN